MIELQIQEPIIEELLFNSSDQNSGDNAYVRN